MLNEKDASKLYKILKPQINKYLHKYRKNINNEHLKEISNDIYIKIYQNFNTLPKTKNEITKYIYVTCKNTVINYKKIKKIDIKYINDNELLENMSDSYNNIENTFILNDNLDYIYNKLTEDKKNIFKYKIMGHTLNEISKLTNISKSSTYRLYNEIIENDVNI